MANKRRVGVSAFTALARRVPWWLSLILALVSFLVLRELGAPPSGGVGAGNAAQAAHVAFMMGLVGLAKVTIPLALLALAGVSLFAVGHGSNEEEIAMAVQAAIAAHRAERHNEDPSARGLAPSAAGASEPRVAATRPTRWDAAALLQLEWRRFEDVCKAYVESLGLTAQRTELRPMRPVDLVLYRPGEDKPFAVAKCAAADAPVGVEPLDQFAAAMRECGVSHGMFLAARGFVPEALDKAKGLAVALIDAAAFVERIARLPKAKQRELFELAFAGDYATPTCPHCGGKMVRRRKTLGDDEGAYFWSCGDYPRCTASLPMAQA